MDEALPALDKALKSLELLSKSDIDEVKSLGKPPGGVRTVISATCVMFEIKPKKEFPRTPPRKRYSSSINIYVPTGK